eukprot:1559577-Pyramimonas_sp.AAC.1
MALAFLVGNLFSLCNLAISLKKFCLTGASPALARAAIAGLEQNAGAYDPATIDLVVGSSPAKHRKVGGGKQQRREMGRGQKTT